MPKYGIVGFRQFIVLIGATRFSCLCERLDIFPPRHLIAVKLRSGRCAQLSICCRCWGKQMYAVDMEMPAREHNVVNVSLGLWHANIFAYTTLRLTQLARHFVNRPTRPSGCEKLGSGDSLRFRGSKALGILSIRDFYEDIAQRCVQPLPPRTQKGVSAQPPQLRYLFRLSRAGQCVNAPFCRIDHGSTSPRV